MEPTIEMAEKLSEFIRTDPEVKQVPIPKDFTDDVAYNVKVLGKFHEWYRVHNSFRECWPYSVEFGKITPEISCLSRSKRDSYLIDLTFMALKLGE